MKKMSAATEARLDWLRAQAKAWRLLAMSLDKQLKFARLQQGEIEDEMSALMTGEKRT